MAKTVAEIMNRELFTVRPGEVVVDVVECLLALGITAAPVIQKDFKPLGVVSLRDLVGHDDTSAAFTRMTAPAATVRSSDTIVRAAEQLADTGYHHLIAVDSKGRAEGFVGTLDVIRGLLGKPVSHPATFPHYDGQTGLTWKDDTPLRVEHASAAPDGPGLLVLVQSSAGEEDVVVWSEATRNVRERVIELASVPHMAPPHLTDALAAGEVRFRCAATRSAKALSAARQAEAATV